MQAKVTTLDSKAAGTVELNDAIFGVPVRTDILNRVIKWQLAKDGPGLIRRAASVRCAAPPPSPGGKKARDARGTQPPVTTIPGWCRHVWAGGA